MTNTYGDVLNAWSVLLLLAVPTIAIVFESI